MCLPVRRRHRKAPTLAHAAGAIWLCDEPGRDERSCKPVAPSLRKRATHVAPVFGVTLNWRAAATGLKPLQQQRAPWPLDLLASEEHSCGCPFGSQRIAGGLATSEFPIRVELDNLLKAHT
jgi:hypothetical protein